MAKDKLDQVFAKVIKEVTPSEKEGAEVTAMNDKVMETARRLAFYEKVKLPVVLAGSFVRNTWMPHKKEFDIFIQFPEKTPRHDLEVYGLDIGKKIVKELKGSFLIAYAEHPYVRAKIGGYAVDIVPSYKVRSAAHIKSAVDRTPFHNKWLEKHMAPSKAPQVRLMKQFIKTQGLYGSDTRVQGFSGYLCELLITKYKTFRALAGAAARWQPGLFIDIEGHHKPSQRSKVRFRGQPMIVIDPVDPERNVAAALSHENFSKFVMACKRLVKKPSTGFFFGTRTKIDIQKLSTALSRRKTRFIAILFPQPQIIQDVLWPQMRKAARRLADILEDDDFRVQNWDVWSDEEFSKGTGSCLLIFNLRKWELPAIKALRGPPIKEKEHSENFLRKYRPLGKTYTHGRYWFAEFKRQFRKADAKLKHSLSDPAKILRAKGIPSHVAKAIAKDFKPLNEKQLISFARKNSGFAELLKAWLKV